MKSQKTQRMALLNRALGGVGALPLSVYCEDITDTTDPTDAGSRLDNLSNASQVKNFHEMTNEMLSYCACAISGSGRRAEFCERRLPRVWLCETIRTMPINMFRNTSCTYTCVGTTIDVAAVYNTCWKPAIQLSCTATSHAFRVKPTISMDRCQCFLKIPLKLHRVNDGVVNMSHSLCS